MGSIFKKFTPTRLVILISCSCLLLISSCARYAHSVNALYEPSTSLRGGSGTIYIVIPENLQTLSPSIKWVIGNVKDSDNNTIDEVSTPRSPAEIIQSAFSREFESAGYTVILATKSHAVEERMIDLTKTDIELNQISDLTKLKAECRVRIGVAVLLNGQPIKKINYEATSSKTDIKDRDMLARSVLDEALQSVMLKAMPELHGLFKR